MAATRQNHKKEKGQSQPTITHPPRFCGNIPQLVFYSDWVQQLFPGFGEGDFPPPVSKKIAALTQGHQRPQPKPLRMIETGFHWLRPAQKTGSSFAIFDRTQHLVKNQLCLGVSPIKQKFRQKLYLSMAFMTSNLLPWVTLLLSLI